MKRMALVFKVHIQVNVCGIWRKAKEMNIVALSNPDGLKRNVKVMPIEKQDYWARGE